MSKDRRTGWLAELQVGDKVFIHSAFGVSLRKVEKISPTGRLTVGVQVFNASGSLRTSDIYSNTRLEEYTEEKYQKHLLRIKKLKLVEYIEKTPRYILRDLPVEALEKFVEAIKEVKGENKND